VTELGVHRPPYEGSLPGPVTVGAP
jgi:hypothetical protein